MYRKSALYASAQSFTVKLDQKDVGELFNGSYMQLPLALGQHVISVKPGALGKTYEHNDDYAEETDWIAPRDGILVLDRTSSVRVADGQINREAVLFKHTWVDGTRRQLSVLKEINGENSSFENGTLDSADPVFTYLRVWHDINGDEVAQSAELEAKVFTIKNIAAYALFAGAEGRFGLKAGNDGVWKVAT